MYPWSFNFFHIVATFCPLLNLFKICVENRVPFVADVKGKTPVHYMLNSQQVNFSNLNYVLGNFFSLRGSVDIYKVSSDLYEDLPGILTLSPDLVVELLKLATGPPQSFENGEITRFGSILGGITKKIAPYKSTIFTPEIQQEMLDLQGNDLLSVRVLLFNMNYDLCSDEVLKLMQVLKDVENEEIFRTRAISILVDYLWDSARPYHYGLVFLSTILIVLLSIYAGKQQEHVSLGLEIVLIIYGFLLLGYECFQLAFAGVRVYFSDVWNVIDILGDVFLIATVLMSWTHTKELGQNWIMSITLFMMYAKWISFFRIIDQTSKKLFFIKLNLHLALFIIYIISLHISNFFDY